GDSVVLETEDANCSLITKETDLWPEFKVIYETAGGCNPVTGPIYVNGAKPGDSLAVTINRVVPGFARGGGYTSIQSGVEPWRISTVQFKNRWRPGHGF
ncbi:acetamidase/formamidase family protein, partial [Enterocloster bolteae]|uniref:acetamidase/formamidase family protein n=1 Tax=Enterocloster bolteae TaxID=208479 RepID=UPI0021099CD9